MLTFKNHYLQERYKNLIHDKEEKAKYASQVWKILQDSYKDIDGIKGKGFSSEQDMIDNIPFWKLAVKDGKVEAVIMYKDKNGRKSVAVGSTGSDWAMTKVKEMFKADISRSFGEKSKGALGLMMKLYPENIIRAFLMTPDEARSLLNKDLTPVKDMKSEDIPKDGKLTLEKYPYLIDYAYMRVLGGKPTFKVMLGTSGKKIT